MHHLFASLKDSEKYHLLQDELETPYQETQAVSQSIGHTTRWKVLGIISTFGLLAASLATNAYFLSFKLASKADSELPSNNRPSRFAGLEYKEIVPIYYSTEYGPAIGTPEDRDRVWAALDISPGILAIPDSYADEMGIPHAQRFPWDQDQGVYLLASFHQMHCLKEIQRAFSIYRRGSDEPIFAKHIEHCLDALLQDVFCHADDTPWYQLPPEPLRADYAPFQTRSCRKWDELLDWTTSYSACYRFDNVTIPDGLRPEEKELEHYRFCPEGSKHKSVMEDYFQKKEMRENTA